MPKKELPNPHLTIGKSMLAALYLWATFTFFVWLFKIVQEPGRYTGFRSDPPSFPSLSMGDMLLGSGWLPIYLWLGWAWQPGRKYARWHRWLASTIAAAYLSVLVLLGGTASWNTLLNPPWNWVVNSILVVLLILAWMLPALSSHWSERIARAQDILGPRMLALGGVAGILGATFGMYASRNGEVRLAIFVVAFGCSLVAIFLAQYNAERLWPYRPWAQEKE